MPNVITGLLDRITGADRRISQAVEKASHVFTVQDFIHGVPMPSSGGDASAAYSNSWVAHACIKRKAIDCAGVPLMVLSDPDDTESEVSDAHPLRRMLEHPSPDFSQSEMIQWWITWLESRGEFFWHFDNWLAPKEMVFWKDPACFTEQLEGGRVSAWRYRNGSDGYTLPRGAVFQHRYVNLDNPWRGQAPAKAAARALSIDVGAERLQDDIIARGGERSVLYEFPVDLTNDQREQALAYLRGRRTGDGTVARDTVMPAGGKVVDPRFVENDLSILDSQKLQPDKICAVFGMSKSLLGIEDIDKYATFQGRRDVYLTNTLLPMLHGIENSLDAYVHRYMPSQWQAFVRFDVSKLEAYAEQLAAKFTLAAAAHAAGLPWTVCNDRFGLGLDTDMIPGAESVLVPAGSVPIEILLEEAANPTPDPVPPVPEIPDGSNDGPEDTVPTDPGEADPEDPPAKKIAHGLTQELVTKRARDVRANIQREIRLLKQEKNMRSDWKKLVGGASKRAQSAIGQVKSPAEVRQVLAPAFDGLGERAVEVASKYHKSGAHEGARSIVEIVGGKMGDAELEVWKARAPWRPQVAEFISQRENLIKGMVDTDLFDDVVAAASKAVVEGVEGDALVKIVADRFDSGPGGLNRAVTIARTEIGAAYSVARNAEMSGQGFAKHMWQTAGDGEVRDGGSPGEFDHAKCDGEVVTIGENFSCGLAFPMAPGGEAGNVINCRCETIPLVAGME
jgi:phage portal protein BeeE